MPAFATPSMIECSFLCSLSFLAIGLETLGLDQREFLRALAVGKPVTFTSTHSLPASDDVPRDIGTAEINGVDLASELLKTGWAKLKDFKRDPTDEDLRKKDLEAEARSAGKGIWNPHGPKVRSLVGGCLPCAVSRILSRDHGMGKRPFQNAALTLDDIQAHATHYMMPTDSQGFITEWKGQQIDGEFIMRIYPL